MNKRVTAIMCAMMLVAAALGWGCAVMAVSETSTASAANGASDGFSTAAAGRCDPLVLDRADLMLGTTVHFTRIPNPNEMRDLLSYPALAHIVIDLDGWPSGYGDVQILNLVPEGPDVIVVLPGYPPTPIANDAWNNLQAPIRLVLLVPGPPPSEAVIDDLNRMRYLERVIAQMEEPRRAGFERLQRPLSFRAIAR